MSIPNYIDIRYFGIDFTELRNIKLISINLDTLKIKKQENPSNRIEQLGVTTYVYDTSTDENVEISYIKVIDNKKFNEFVFGVVANDGGKIITPYIKLKTSIKYFEQDGEKRENNSKPLNISEYQEFIMQIKDYLEDEYEIIIDVSEAKWEALELTRQFTLKEKYCKYSLLLEAFYRLAPARLWGYEEDKRKKAHGLDYERDKEYGQYIDTMRLGNASVGEIIYNKTKQLKAVYEVEIEIEMMRVELKLKNSNQCDKAFGDKSIFEITDEDLKEYFLKRIQMDLIQKYKEFIHGVDEEGRKKKISLEKKLERRANIKKYKNDKGKYKSGWANMFFVDVYSLKDKETGMILAQDTDMILNIIKKKTKNNYARTLKTLNDSIEERPETKGNLDRFAEINDKLLNI